MIKNEHNSDSNQRTFTDKFAYNTSSLVTSKFIDILVLTNSNVNMNVVDVYSTKLSTRIGEEVLLIIVSSTTKRLRS